MSPERSMFLAQSLRHRKQQKHAENLERYYQAEYGFRTGRAPKDSSDDGSEYHDQSAEQAQGTECSSQESSGDKFRCHRASRHCSQRQESLQDS